MSDIDAFVRRELETHARLCCPPKLIKPSQPLCNRRRIEMDTQPTWWQVMRHRIRAWIKTPDTRKDIAQLYSELLMAVESKYPGESRHETALRYIRSQEHGKTRVGAAKAVHNAEVSGAGTASAGLPG